MPTNPSGKCGKIQIGASELSDIRNWNFERTSNNPPFGSSSSNGHQKSVAGRKGGQITFEAVLDTNQPKYSKIVVGGAYTLLLYETQSRFWSVPARIDSIGEAVDINEGGEILENVTASVNGQWTDPDGNVSASGC